jgi:signal transduction histidine kinase/DNA-binding response OmpR family regulator
MCQRVLASGQSESREYPLEVIGGRHWFRARVSPIVAEDGARRTVCMLISDITARRHIEEKLRESEAQYRSLFEHLVEGFAYCQMIFEAGQPTDWVYLAVNDSFTTLTGLSNVTGKRVTEVIPDIRATDPELFEIYARVSLTGTPERFERFVNALALWFAISVYSPQTGFFVAVFDVITQRKQAELALQEAHERLEQRVQDRTVELAAANTALAKAAKLKDEFLASMSHELRTPLTGILGLTEALQMGVYGALNEKQASITHLVEESGRHLLNLINDILDLSKIEAGKLELEFTAVNVDDLCQASLRLVKQMALQKHQTVGVALRPPELMMYADVRRLKQALVNLLSNAVKFTPENGKLGLEVIADPVQSVVHFTVWDNGLGIAPEDMAKLFKPFVQLDSSLARTHTGTGLGLSLVQRLTELHGGSIALESVPGQGSRFTLTFPWSVEVALSSTTTTLGAPAVIASVLVVDDSPIAVGQTIRYLDNLGIHKVITHAQSQGAVEQARITRPAVILLDILLPDGNGWDVLRQLKADADTRPIPVIVVSVVDDRSQALQLGASAYLLKPITQSDLQQALDHIRRSHTFDVPESVMVVAAAPKLSTILLAEDHEINRLLIGDYLKAQGYPVLFARDGNEALQLVQAQRPDLVLMDIQMPGMDGLEAIYAIRALNDSDLAHLPIIALTALTMPGDRERCLAAGANDYLSKPIKLETLTALIKRQLEP